MKKIYLILSICITSTTINAQWNQKGLGIDGEAALNRSGDEVSMSADGNTLGIGARRNFEIVIPSIDDYPCISFLFLGEHTSVPDNIKFGEPEIVPLIAGDLSQHDIEYYVKELGFKPPERFTPPEKEAVKARLMEEYPEMSIDCINAALDIDTDGDNLLTSPTATTHLHHK